MTDRVVTVPDSLEIPAAVKVPSARLSDSTAAGRALLDAADAAAQRAALGLGTAATHAHGDYATAEQGAKADGAAQKSASLSDIADAAAARTNLGLGDAATKAVGTTAGTVKAGDWQPTAADVTDATDAGRALLTADDAAAQRTALGMTAFAPAAAQGSGLPRPRPTMHQTLQSGHGWTKNGAAGTVADDTASYVIGSQSLKLTTDGSATATVARKTGIAAIDLSARDLIVWIKCDNWAACSELFFYLSSDTFTNSKVISYQVASPVPYALDNEWVPVTLSFHTATTTGSPNMTAITAMQVHFKAPGVTASLWVGGIGSIPRPSAGTVSVTFDDGNASVYTYGIPVMSRYGIPATMYTICDRIGTSRYLTLAQLTEMHRLHGWDVATHAGTIAAHNARYTTLTDAEIDADLAYARHWMSEHGFTGGGDHFAWPGGMYDESSLARVRKHCVTARSTWTKTVETAAPADPHRLRIFGVYNTTTAAQVTAAIDKCVAEKSWLILMFHYITPTGRDDDSTEFPVDDLETVMAYLVSSGVTVRTVGEVAKYGIS